MGSFYIHGISYFTKQNTAASDDSEFEVCSLID